MDYFRLFNLEKEPFANTPDPEFFYRSTRHARCMQNVELAIRLRRGLCIVRGEVGTGKTTLCRQLIRTLSDDETMDVHLVLDPGYDSTQEFAAAVGRMIAGRQKADECSTVADFKEMIKNQLFDTGVDSGKTIVLIIDEGQKLTGGCAEFLRELLNYETNTHKLLQIVIFAQNEIRELLLAHPGFADRAALYHLLEPLDRKETARLIEHRLEKAGGSGKAPGGPRFTRRAISAIYRISRGYPRSTIHLAHNILLLLLVKGSGTVTPGVVRRAAAGLPDVKKTPPAGSRLKAAGIVFAAAVIVLAAMAAYPRFTSENGPEEKETASAGKTSVRADQAAYDIL
ncbi:MAG: ExeA family protein, partial [Desulfobacterales bacterium]